MKHDSLKDFVLDQLAALPDLRLKAMFGGHGLYQGGDFFGILMHGRVYFRVDDDTRAACLARGMQPFVYEKARKTTALNYFEVPPDVLESRDEFVKWAKAAIRRSADERTKS